MALEVYRVYPAVNVLPERAAHLFSIVTTENSAAYATPNLADPKLNEFVDFDEDRIKIALSMEEEGEPKTALDWALMASQNMSAFSVVKVENIDYETVEEAITEESYLSEDAWYERNGTNKEEPITAAIGECPPATQDIALNLKNRKNAIDTAMYGPLNPDEPNEEYWQGLANEWKVDVETAKKQRCGNCAVFVVTTDMKNCIAQGIEQGGSSESDAWDAIGTADLGYCEAFDFKCAASRTCRAWVTGGPIDDSKAKEQ